MKKKEAKCSVITPRGEGGIGVILLYGRDSASVLEACFTGTKRRVHEIAPGRLAHGRITEGKTAIDEVVLAHFGASESVLNEPSYEVNCHGGIIAVQAVFQRLQSEGATPVSWREVMNQGISTDREPLSAKAIRSAALGALPEAETRPVAKMLLHQADGALYAEISDIATKLAKDGESAFKRLQNLLGSADSGIALLNPPRVMLAGPPNAGKSTLLNALLQRERVIVHPTPGTTRDVVKDRLAIGGVPFDIMDSAGLRDRVSEVETKAIDRSLQLLREADIVLWLFDVRQNPAVELEQVPADSLTSSRTLYVANKCDLSDSCGKARAEDLSLPHSAPVVFTSAKERTGLERVEEFLLEPYGDIINRCESGHPTIFTESQRNALATAAYTLEGKGSGQAASVLSEAGVNCNS